MNRSIQEINHVLSLIAFSHDLNFAGMFIRFNRGITFPIAGIRSMTESPFDSSPSFRLTFF